MKELVCREPGASLLGRVVVLLLGMLVNLTALSYELVDLGADVVPQDINNVGTVVGSRNASQYPATAFLYDMATGSFEDIDGTTAYAINDAEQVVGSTLTGAFLLDGNNLRTWDEHGAYGISELGLVAGNKAGKNPYRTTSIPYNPAVYEGSKWSVMDIAQVYPRGTRQGVYADIYLLDDINDAGYTVGSRRRYGLAGSSAIMIAPPYSGIRDGADVTYLSIPAGGAAKAINDSNTIVGTTGNDSRNGIYASGFVYEDGAVTLLEPLPDGLRSSAADINESDMVVGSSETGGANHAYLWNAASGMVDLNELISDPGWVLIAAAAVNDFGDIVGTGQLDGQDHGFLLVNGAAPPPPPPVNQAPVAVAEADVTSGRAPLEVHFNGGKSYDPDGLVMSYRWDFGDGSSASVEMNPPVHAYRLSGTYLATLEVTDDLGIKSTPAVLEITVRKGRGSKK